MLHDTAAERLLAMDEAGIDIAVLSSVPPGIQSERNAKKSVPLATSLNDQLAEIVSGHPDRYRAFAALPMLDPQAAAAELHRAVTELGFVGAMINGYSQDENGATYYYDDEAWWPVWETAERLGAPVYLHPRQPADRPIALRDRPELMGSAWAFGIETATHALRLMTSGLFDHFPALNLILGHLGEGLVHLGWRIGHRMSRGPIVPKMRLNVPDYLRSNVYVTTSGNFDTPALVNCMSVLGPRRIMFATDYPFESMGEAATWFDAADIPETDRDRISRGNFAGRFLGTAAAKPTA
ncbi:hypothetical protein ADL21_02985 [Streptomyces albus subsp. albus]|nr:hypothetical protein ADL21_02985 [Streptomyces albus subsp. albus]